MSTESKKTTTDTKLEGHDISVQEVDNRKDAIVEMGKKLPTNYEGIYNTLKDVISSNKGLDESLLNFAKINPSLAKATLQAALLYKYSFLPAHITTVQQAVIAFQYGRELGLPFITSLDLLYFVNNKPTPNARGIVKLIRDEGHHFNPVRDAEMVLTTTDPRKIYLEGELVKVPVKDEKGELIKDAKGNIRETVQPRQFTWTNKQNKQVTSNLLVTTIYAYRKEYPNADPVIIQYTNKDAADYGLLEKDNWIKQTPAMMMARCVTKMGRYVYGDVLGGSLVYDEMTDDNSLIDSSETNVDLSNP